MTFRSRDVRSYTREWETKQQEFHFDESVMNCGKVRRRRSSYVTMMGMVVIPMLRAFSFISDQTVP